MLISSSWSLRKKIKWKIGTSCPEVFSDGGDKGALPAEVGKRGLRLDRGGGGEMWDEGTRVSLLACLNALPFKSLHPDPTSPSSCCFSFTLSVPQS